MSGDPDIVDQIKPAYPQLQDLRADDADTPEDAPIEPGETIRIDYREPMLVTRAGSDRTYDGRNLENGKPVGEAWSLSETAVRGLMRRYEWTRVEGKAQASVRGE
ncbi:hypothetical protein NDI76_04010 [Halogeometricum sp. S1BR25-6]|uniref:Uncharacterized protein n=1 Tax=Halogeometricum salsisoli TaxID=2950536 RepID=A0ABU2GAR6_9EURY|nr:hypothetical protein [Halogeometricum sp. S1BR25-6]MDS0297897.1 hypothetical protein [Halogeometricum sp. S1BR25-6]